MPQLVERFAPSPNGYLHLGHAFSALTAFRAAQAAGGRFLLRIEDIDLTRARPRYETAIREDLAWLGLSWETPILRQSARLPAYRAALGRLAARGLLYPCFCTRREISAALSAPQEGASATETGTGSRVGPDGPPYPGLCRNAPDAKRRTATKDHALRLDMRRAVASLGGDAAARALWFEEIGEGPGERRGRIALDAQFLIEACGDVVLARKDIAASYHLSVAADDAHQGVTTVTRGRDLFHATQIHRLLQALLGLPTPRYRHHLLIRDAGGRRLAKRDGDESLRALRARGVSPGEVRRMVGLD